MAFSGSEKTRLSVSATPGRPGAGFDGKEEFVVEVGYTVEVRVALRGSQPREVGLRLGGIPGVNAFQLNAYQRPGFQGEGYTIQRTLVMPTQITVLEVFDGFQLDAFQRPGFQGQVHP